MLVIYSLLKTTTLREGTKVLGLVITKRVAQRVLSHHKETTLLRVLLNYYPVHRKRFENVNDIVSLSVRGRLT